MKQFVILTYWVLVQGKSQGRQVGILWRPLDSIDPTYWMQYNILTKQKFTALFIMQRHGFWAVSVQMNDPTIFRQSLTIFRHFACATSAGQRSLKAGLLKMGLSISDVIIRVGVDGILNNNLIRGGGWHNKFDWGCWGDKFDCEGLAK